MMRLVPSKILPQKVFLVSQIGRSRAPKRRSWINPFQLWSWSWARRLFFYAPNLLFSQDFSRLQCKDCRNGSSFVSAFCPGHHLGKRRRKDDSKSRKVITVVADGSSGTELIDDLRESYTRSSTDGVAEFVSRRLMECDEYQSILHSPQEVMAMALEAGQFQSGRISSMLHGFMAGLTVSEQYYTNAKLFDLMLSNEENKIGGVTVDMVTCSLIYNSCYLGLTLTSDKEEPTRKQYFEKMMNLSLNTALKLAKKSGGSSQRKAMAQAKRNASKYDSDSSLSSQNNLTTIFTDCLDILASKYGVDVLYEDNDVVCLNKPAGMVCYHERKTTKGKRGEDTSLVDALLTTVSAAASPPPLSLINPDARGLVHRIDRGTSGCIVLAKTNDAHLRLVASFFMRQCHKSYLALVHGDVKDNDGVIDLPVGNQPAFSRYRVKHKYRNNSNDIMSSLVEVSTETGRKHQVRVHCANGLKCPIYLDDLYFPKSNKSMEAKSKKTKKQTPKKRQSASNGTVNHEIPPSILAAGDGIEQDRFFLHAATLQIPSFGIEVEAPVPIWWNEAINGLDEAIECQFREHPS